MQTLEIKGLSLPGIFNYEELLKSIHTIIYASSIKEVRDTCTRTEIFFEKAYREYAERIF